MKHYFKSREPTININRSFRARRQFVATNCFLLLETRRGVEVQSLRSRHHFLIIKISRMKLSYIKFRCTLEEKTTILRRSQRAGRTMSDFCREQILSGTIHEAPKFTAEEVEYFKNLHIYHTNFVRLSNYIKYQDPELSNEIRQFLDEFRRVTDRFFPKKGTNDSQV